MRRIGPTLDAYKARAEEALDRHTNPMLRNASLDAWKLAQASAVLAGGASSLLTAEAALRGMTPDALAEAIHEAAAKAEAGELRRVATKLTIRAAMTHTEVRAALAAHGIPFEP